MKFESPLRDLARKIRETARDHIARSQAADFLNHVDSHLNALALIEEINRREASVAVRSRAPGAPE